MSGFTPGPWEWVGADLSGWKARGQLRGMFGDSPATYPILNEPGVINGITVELDSHDARLIAAAPDLLAACEESLTWQAEGENGDPIPLEHCTPAYRNFVLRLRAAISKARGDGA